MQVDVIVLNGGSSSGKSSLATCLQKRLAGAWLVLGIDDLIRAISHGQSDTTAGGTLDFRADGSIGVGESFRRAEESWYAGLAAIARTGTGVVVDDVFLDGKVSQARLGRAVAGLAVLWVGVRCRPEIAEAREVQRGDRARGLARHQAERVHEGVTYDIVIDTSDSPPGECARLILERWEGRSAGPVPYAMAESVIDDAAHGLFALSMEGATAKLAYQVDGDRLLLLHTEVPEEFRRQGVAGRLVEAALTRAGSDRLTIVPWCPYARRWLKEHPERIGDVVVDFKTPPPQG